MILTTNGPNADGPCSVRDPSGGGSPNRSQKLMRLRVLLQFVAIIVIMATIWAMGR